MGISESNDFNTISTQSMRSEAKFVSDDRRDKSDHPPPLQLPSNPQGEASFPLSPILQPCVKETRQNFFALGSDKCIAIV